MEKRLIIIPSIMVFLLLFVSLGLPGLRMIKDSMHQDDLELIYGENFSMDSNPIKVVNLYEESVCKDPLSGDLDLRCQSAAGCDAICRLKGCSFFNYAYNNSDFSERNCKCICLDESLVSSVEE